MDCGNFSVSLSVKDIAASRAFYESLAYEVLGGEQEQGWLILRNPTSIIGLFQGMFPKNIMTFNPGWDKDQSTLPDFEDVRELQAKCLAAGIEPDTQADPEGTGPASFVIQDPDGNPILFDQHVNKPE